jgi:hypothetical protein
VANTLVTLDAPGAREASGLPAAPEVVDVLETARPGVPAPERVVAPRPSATFDTVVPTLPLVPCRSDGGEPDDGGLTAGVVADGTVATGVVTRGVVTDGTVTVGLGAGGVVTVGVVSFGVVTGGVVTTGVLTEGTVTDGTVAVGMVSFGAPALATRCGSTAALAASGWTASRPSPAAAIAATAPRVLLMVPFPSSRPRACAGHGPNLCIATHTSPGGASGIRLPAGGGSAGAPVAASHRSRHPAGDGGRQQGRLPGVRADPSLRAAGGRQWHGAGGIGWGQKLSLNLKERVVGPSLRPGVRPVRRRIARHLSEHVCRHLRHLVHARSFE